MKINKETTVSEEQVLFNKLNWENQQMILRIMRYLQPCELSCEVEEEKKIPEKLKAISNKGDYKIIYPTNEILTKKINEIIDYLKSKGE
jgi:hypothetical protein